jgi:hypothetical protein
MTIRKGDDPMSQATTNHVTHEPSLETIEMLCERLGEQGMPIGPDTARELARAVLEMEAPRMEAHVRDAIETSLDTIRIATQSALGVLTATERLTVRVTPPGPPKPVLDPPHNRRTPAQGVRPVGIRNPVPKRKPGEQSGERPLGPEPRRNRDGFDGDEQRPVFRRPRGR